MDEYYRTYSVGKSSRFRMGQSEFQRKGFDNDGVFRLFCNNKEANKYNNYQISKLQTNKSRYIAKITAVSSAKAKKILKDRQTTYLINFLCVWIRKLY